MARSDVICSVAEYSAVAAEVDLLDVRWRLGEPAGEGRQRYLGGHLPGARFLSLEGVLTAHTGNPLDGCHPLPDPEDLARGLGELGITGDRQIIVYDEPGSFAAGRAWWVLTWAGLDVRVLDGGITAWTAAGLPLVAGEVAAEPTTITLAPGQLPTIDADDAAAWPGILIDARAAERYRGEIEPIDPRAGHIPGAINVPVTQLWAADGTLPDDLTLRELFPADSTPMAAYCGSGVSRPRPSLALEGAGVEASLFGESWSGWSNDPARPAALGERP
ncbi:MAG: sulfurtransferase [Micropruina sp.]|nr:sulfurtransferase [Micropruina sp.]